ncbi:hypothetical protein AB0K88_24300 [Streptomyces werraensis]
MSDSANVVQACACGGTVVITPARSGADAETKHLDAAGKPAVCPAD